MGVNKIYKKCRQWPKDKRVILSGDLHQMIFFIIAFISNIGSVEPWWLYGLTEYSTILIG